LRGHNEEEQGERSPGMASDPISLVAAEIHLGLWPAVITDGWLGLPYSSYVPAQQLT
jgi:hypothetical protein